MHENTRQVHSHMDTHTHHAPAAVASCSAAALAATPRWWWRRTPRPEQKAAAAGYTGRALQSSAPPSLAAVPACPSSTPSPSCHCALLMLPLQPQQQPQLQERKGSTRSHRAPGTMGASPAARRSRCVLRGPRSHRVWGQAPQKSALWVATYKRGQPAWGLHACRLDATHTHTHLARGQGKARTATVQVRGAPPFVLARFGAAAVAPLSLTGSDTFRLRCMCLLSACMCTHLVSMIGIKNDLSGGPCFLHV